MKEKETELGGMEGGREGSERDIYIYTYVDFSYKFRIFKKLQSTLKIPTLSLILQQIKQNQKNRYKDIRDNYNIRE